MDGLLPVKSSSTKFGYPRDLLCYHSYPVQIDTIDVLSRPVVLALMICVRRFVDINSEKLPNLNMLECSVVSSIRRSSNATRFALWQLARIG